MPLITINRFFTTKHKNLTSYKPKYKYPKHKQNNNKIIKCTTFPKIRIGIGKWVPLIQNYSWKRNFCSDCEIQQILQTMTVLPAIIDNKNVIIPYKKIETSMTIN